MLEIWSIVHGKILIIAALKPAFGIQVDFNYMRKCIWTAARCWSRPNVNTHLHILNSTVSADRLASPSEQLVPPSAAVFPGGLCLPQLAVEWNNHAVAPREQKGSTPIFRLGGVLVKQRVTAQGWGFDSVFVCFAFLPLSALKDHSCNAGTPLLMKSKEIVHFDSSTTSKIIPTCLL